MWPMSHPGSALRPRGRSVGCAAPRWVWGSACGAADARCGGTSASPLPRSLAHPGAGPPVAMAATSPCDGQRCHGNRSPLRELHCRSSRSPPPPNPPTAGQDGGTAGGVRPRAAAGRGPGCQQPQRCPYRRAAGGSAGLLARGMGSGWGFGADTGPGAGSGAWGRGFWCGSLAYPRGAAVRRWTSVPAEQRRALCPLAWPRVPTARPEPRSPCRAVPRDARLTAAVPSPHGRAASSRPAPPSRSARSGPEPSWPLWAPSRCRRGNASGAAVRPAHHRAG